MTSKEAFNKLKTLELWNGELECYSDLYTLKPELFKVIQKDLEILEIFKNKNVDINLIKNIMKDKRDFNCYPYDDLTEEEFNKIEEWLEK